MPPEQDFVIRDPAAADFANQTNVQLGSDLAVTLGRVMQFTPKLWPASPPNASDASHHGPTLDSQYDARPWAAQRTGLTLHWELTADGLRPRWTQRREIAVVWSVRNVNVENDASRPDLAPAA